MKFTTTVLPALLGLAVMGLTRPALSDDSKDAKFKEVPIKNAKGERIGVAKLREVDGGVKFVVSVAGIEPGKHGIHIHENARCDGPDFKSAGSHFNPEDKKHGLESKNSGPHAGDLPNLFVKKDGRGKLETFSKKVTLGDGDNSLFRDGGTAIVIHETSDDQKTDPAGKSGDRIACGVISRDLSAENF